MIPDDLEKLWKKAFGITAARYRKTGFDPRKHKRLNLPIENTVREICRDSGQYLPQHDIELMARQIATGLRRNWLSRNERTPPKEGRAKRTLKEQRVLQILSDAEKKGEVLSRRKLAGRCGISTTRLQRILTRHGRTGSTEFGNLRTHARRLAKLVCQYMPVDGKRIFGRDRLAAAAQISISELASAISEINGSDSGIALVEAKAIAPDGQVWVVGSRGRRREPASLMQWFAEQETVRINDHRGAQRPSQHIYLPWVETFVDGAVERDIASVIHIQNGTFDLGQWSRFIEASVSLDDTYPISTAGHDRAALVTVVQSALRLQGTEFVQTLSNARSWPEGADLQKAAAEIFDLARTLILDDYSNVGELLAHWSRTVAYLERISDGDLLGRNRARAEDLLDMAVELDEPEFADVLFGIDQPDWSFLPEGLEESDIPEFLKTESEPDQLAAAEDIERHNEHDEEEADLERHGYYDDPSSILPDETD